jgi:hypothetical protein
VLNANKIADILQRNSEKCSNKNDYLKKILEIEHSNLCVCGHNYRAFYAQAPYHVDVAGLIPSLCHIIPNISTSAQFLERRLTHKIFVLAFSKIFWKNSNFKNNL